MPAIALLVIDMLNDFFRRDAHLAEQRPRLVEAINALVETFRRQDQPVIWVRQEFAPDLHDAFLEMRQRNLRVTIAGTDGCEILPGRISHSDAGTPQAPALIAAASDCASPAASCAWPQADAGLAAGAVCRASSRTAGRTRSGRPRVSK